VVRIVDQDSAGQDVAPSTETPSALSDGAEASPAGRPYFRAASGWEAVQVGSAVTAANVPLGQAALSGSVPWDTVEHLDDGDVVLFAMLVPAGESSAVDAIFPRREIPLSLRDAQRGGLEGQPDDSYAERLAAQVNGWNIDLLIFYGGTDPIGVAPYRTEPGADARAAAEEELARLVVPEGA
jgi:hypothetical protein